MERSDGDLALFDSKLLLSDEAGRWRAGGCGAWRLEAEDPQKCLLSIRMKNAFSFLRKRRRRAVEKESFFGFWSFGEFFLFSFFSSSFHFPRSWGKKREEYGSAFHLERTSRRLKGNQFHWNETEKNNKFGRKLNYKQSQDQSFFPIWQVSHCSKDFWLIKKYVRTEKIKGKRRGFNILARKKRFAFFQINLFL